MAVQRHLSRAPAREALIDIEFESPASLEAIDAFIANAAKDFKRRTDLSEAFIGFRSDGSGTRASQTVIGRRLDSDEPPHVLQCRRSGFTFSRLSPYGEWAELRGAAQGWWDQFYRTIGPRTVTRIAVRYVNAITLPLPITDFTDYLVCPPRLPPSLPQGVSGFLQRVIVPDDVNNCTCIVTQALEDQPAVSSGGASITVLLDIDVFRITRIEDADMAQVWAGLDELRVQKNRMFFEHLTEKAMEMFA